MRVTSNLREGALVAALGAFALSAPSLGAAVANDAGLFKRVECNFDKVVGKPATALEGLISNGADHYIDLGDPYDTDPIDPLDLKEKRSLDDAHLLKTLSDLTVRDIPKDENEKRDDSTVEIPSSEWWKIGSIKKWGQPSGYVEEGNKYSKAWAVVSLGRFTQISDLRIGTVDKKDIPQRQYKKGPASGWQADHVLEAQTINAFFKADLPKRGTLLKKLTDGWVGKGDISQASYSSFPQLPNCYIQQLVAVFNGEGNVQALAAALNGAKGSLFKGDKLDPTKGNNNIRIFGVLRYMEQATLMFDQTKDLIAGILNQVYDDAVGREKDEIGKWGPAFQDFATRDWEGKIKELTNLYEGFKTVKPILSDGFFKDDFKDVGPFQASGPGLGDKRPRPDEQGTSASGGSRMMMWKA